MDADKWMELLARRDEIITKAAEAADRIILDGSDGSVEETDYLTAEVARKLMERALNPFYRAMLKKDMVKSEAG